MDVQRLPWELDGSAEPSVRAAKACDGLRQDHYRADAWAYTDGGKRYGVL